MKGMGQRESLSTRERERDAPIDVIHFLRIRRAARSETRNLFRCRFSSSTVEAILLFVLHCRARKTDQELMVEIPMRSRLKGQSGPRRAAGRLSLDGAPPPFRKKVRPFLELQRQPKQRTGQPPASNKEEADSYSTGHSSFEWALGRRPEKRIITFGAVHSPESSLNSRGVPFSFPRPRHRQPSRSAKMSNRSPIEEYAERARRFALQNRRRVPFGGGGGGGNPVGLAALAALGVGGFVLLQNSLFNVDGGHRAIKYTRLNGVSKEIYNEGTPGRPESILQAAY